jgi:PKD repeat protein
MTPLIVVLAGVLGLLVMPSSAGATLYNLRASPLASFVWSPQLPKIGDTVRVMSTSSARGSPITSYAWDFSDNGPFGRFETGGPAGSVGFVTPGRHVVRLRVGTAEGLTSIAAETITMSPLPRSAGVMYPFPIVSIRGRDFPRGVRLSRLAVKAPPGSSITVSCSQARCPAKEGRRIAPSRSGHSSWLPFRRFERFLPAGAILQVRVSKSGKIGSYTRFHVRRRKLPVRSDSCLDLAGATPIACPRS